MKNIIVEYYRDYFKVYDFSDNVIFARGLVFILLLVSAIILYAFAGWNYYVNLYKIEIIIN